MTRLPASRARAARSTAWTAGCGFSRAWSPWIGWSPFDEDTPDALLELLRPHILAKGGDYEPQEVVGADFVRSYGGTVRVLGHVEDCSTTAILESMKSRGTRGA